MIDIISQDVYLVLLWILLQTVKSFWHIIFSFSKIILNKSCCWLPFYCFDKFGKPLWSILKIGNTSPSLPHSWLLQESDKSQIFYWSSQTCTRIMLSIGWWIVNHAQKPENGPIFNLTQNTFYFYCLILKFSTKKNFQKKISKKKIFKKKLKKKFQKKRFKKKNFKKKFSKKKF